MCKPGKVALKLHSNSILIFNVGLPAIDVVRMTSGTTAKMMGIFDRKGSIAVGKDADINIVDAQFNVVKTFCKGVPVDGE